MEYFDIISKEISVFNNARLRIVDRASKEIHDNLSKFKTSEDYKKYIEPFKNIISKEKRLDRLNYSMTIKAINFRVFERIFADGRMNDKSANKRYSNLKRLIFLADKNLFKIPFQKSLNTEIRQMIFAHRGMISTEITSVHDIILFIENIYSYGLTVDHTKLQDELNTRLKQIKSIEERLEYKNNSSQIISHIERLNNLSGNGMKSFNTGDLRKLLKRRQTAERVVIDGKHLKDELLSLSYLKLNYSCKTEECSEPFDILPIISLDMGIKLGGIDDIINYQILCEKHRKEPNELNKMKSDYDRLEYLRNKYPEIIKKSMEYK